MNNPLSTLRKCLLFFSFIISSVVSYAQTWEVVNEQPHELYICGIHFVDENLGWAVGEYETIVKTTDGGTNWQMQRVGKEKLRDVYFFDNQNGWVVGDNGLVLHTDDGGTNWDLVDVGSPNSYFLKILFLNENKGFITDYSNVFKTEDGGDTWTITDITSSENNNIVFVSDTKGYVYGDNGTVNITEDGGNTWEEFSDNISDKLDDVHFLDEEIGYAVHSDGTAIEILRTINGGGFWYSIFNESANGFGKHLEFVDDNIGYANSLNKFYKTTDGGLNWETSSLDGIEQVVYDMQVIDDNIWLCTRYGRIHKSDDGGESWDFQEYEEYQDIKQALFTFDNEKIWVAGSEIYISNNGGLSFTEIDQPGDEMQSIWFTNNSDGFAVGENGTAIKTTNGGNSWSLMNVPTNSHLTRIIFANESKGWIIGEDGKIFNTANGGQTWTAQASGYSVDLIDIEVINENELWIIGEEEHLLYTTDGGNDWMDVYLQGAFEYTDIAFSGNTGLLVGDGQVLRTTNGGSDWEQVTVNNNSGNKFEAVFPINQQMWMLTNKENELYVSNNGGQSWTLTYVPARIDYFTRPTFFVNNEEAWIVAGLRNILHYPDNITPVYNPIQDVTSRPLSFSPNPTTGSIEIKCPKEINWAKEEYIYNIYSMDGTLLRTIPLNNEVTVADLSDLSSGIYLISLFDAIENQLYNGQVVIQR